jgi:hypothetical protein
MSNDPVPYERCDFGNGRRSGMLHDPNSRALIFTRSCNTCIEYLGIVILDGPHPFTVEAPEPDGVI